MFKYTFESNFENIAELRKEVTSLLWEIDHTWPIMGLFPNKIKWISEKINRALLKLNGGSLRQSIELSQEKSP